MSDPRSRVLIKLYNKQLYDFLARFAQKGLFQKDKLIITSSSDGREFPFENLSEIGKREWDENTDICIIDRFGGDVYHVPEGIYDVIPCFLIYIAGIFEWEKDTFLEFKECLLKEQSEIVKSFDKVVWEAEWNDNRYSWDGIYKWTETFCYDRFSDCSEHNKTIHKLGLDADKYLDSGYCDEDERPLYQQAIKDRSKYEDYDWDALCERLFDTNLMNEDILGEDSLAAIAEDEG
jgi:hypothetical protein